MNLLTNSSPQTSIHGELAAAMSAARLGVLAASIAHEVNQPLAGIIINAGTCLRMLAMDPPNIHGALETARRTIRDGNRAAEVVTHLRALFANKDYLLEPVSLNDVATDVCSSLTADFERNDVMLQLELEDGLPAVAGIRVQLRQVIFNLVRNGLDAMKQVEDRPRRLVIRTESGEHDSVHCSVVDFGIGFNPETAERLFDTFYTTKHNGMGIGLSVSKCIVERFQGRLWAERNNGPGSSFGFSIPFFDGAFQERDRWGSLPDTLVPTDTIV